MSSTIKINSQTKPKTSTEVDDIEVESIEPAEVEVESQPEEPDAVEYGKGGVYRSLGGGKRVKV